MGSKIKILFITYSMYNGGAERSLVNLLNELNPEKYEINLLLFRKEGVFLNQIPKYVNILETPSNLKSLYESRFKANKFLFFKIYATLISKFKEKSDKERKAYRWYKYYSKKIEQLNPKFDISIAFLSDEILYYLCDKVVSNKKIAWVHNDYKTAGHPYKYDKKYFGRVDKLVTISKKCEDILAEKFPEYRDKIIYLNNLTSKKIIIQKANDFYPLEYSNRKNIIISIGRLTHQKNFSLAIDVAKELKHKNFNFYWYIIGDGEEFNKLNKSIIDNDLSNNVFLLGRKENPYPYIKNAKILVQTSLFEGKSVVLDEAKILNLPIISTNYPTVGDQIKEGYEGLIVDFNYKQLSDKIIDILSNQIQYDKIVNYLSINCNGNDFEVKYYDKLFSDILKCK